MGIVKRQGIKHSLVSYFGVLIGAINVLFIYPTTFSTEELGLVRFILDTAILLTPFVILGFNQISLRFFPDFKIDNSPDTGKKSRQSQNGHNGLLFFLVLGSSIGFAVFILLTFLFKSNIYTFYANKSDLFVQYLEYIPPLVGLMIFVSLFHSFCINIKRITMSAVFGKLYLKIGLPILALLYFWGKIGMSYVIQGLIVTYVLILLSYILYLLSQGHFNLKPNFTMLTRGKVQEMMVYGFYGVLTTMGTVLTLHIDTFMLATFSENTLSSAGIYTIPNFISNALAVPTVALTVITTPLIAQSWKDNNTAHIQELYSKTSINLLVIGLLMLIGVWASVENLYNLIPNGERFAPGMNAVLILGLGKVFDMATSVNQQIIGLSKYFRFNFYSLAVLAVLNIALNLILIPKYQIMGAAMATMFSIFLFNIFKFLYIWWKMKMQPFSVNTIKVLLIGLFVYLLAYFMPTTGISLIDMILRSILIVSVYCFLVWKFNISEDLNKLPAQIWNKARNILGR